MLMNPTAVPTRLVYSYERIRYVRVYYSRVALRYFPQTLRVGQQLNFWKTRELDHFYLRETK